MEGEWCNLTPVTYILKGKTDYTIHTLPKIEEDLKPMILIFKHCSFLETSCDTTCNIPLDLSRYRVKVEQRGCLLKELYKKDEWNNAYYIILKDYSPDKDSDLKVDAPFYSEEFHHLHLNTSVQESFGFENVELAYQVQLSSNKAATGSINISGPIALNNPQEFILGKTDLANPCTDKEAKALTIFYKDVIDDNFEIQPFDVQLTFIPEGFKEITWTRHKGPDSGILTNADQAVATFSNPEEGGLYQFDVIADNIPETHTRTNLWLPVAGPDISYYWENEIDYFKNQWGPSYRKKLDRRTSVFTTQMTRAFMKHVFSLNDMKSLGPNLDWMGQVEGEYTPCGGPNIVGDLWRQTLYGVVIDFAKRNNMMYALIGREMGLSEFELMKAPNLPIIQFGTPDKEEQFESYRAGFDLFNGESLEEVMKKRGHKMQAPGSWSQKEWPSYEISYEGLERKAEKQLKELIR